MTRRQPVNPVSWRDAVFLPAAAALLLAGGCGPDPQKAAVSAAQAQSLLESGKLPAARAAIKAAIREQDDVAEFHLLRGRIEFAANAREAAFRAYADALSLDAVNLEALQAVAQLGLQTGHLEESEDAADRLLVLQPDQPDGLLVKGLQELARNRRAAAEDYADRVLAIAPRHEGATILKARLLFFKGKADEAMALVRRAQPPDGASEGITLTLLELHRAAGEVPGMLVQFDRLEALRPDDDELRVDEANVRYKTGDTAGARRLLERLVLANDVKREILAKTIGLWREYDTAPLSPASEAELAARAPERVKIEIARHFLDTGHAARAIALLADAKSADAAALRARSHARLGASRQAVHTAERILRRDPTQCDAQLVIAEDRTSRGKFDEAVTAAQSSIAECPLHDAGYLMLARAYRAKGNFELEQRAYADGLSRIEQSTDLTAAYAERLLDRAMPARAVVAARRLTRAAPALVSGWRLFAATCRRAGDAACAAEAERGSTAARGMLSIDLLPGERSPNGLYGRLRR